MSPGRKKGLPPGWASADVQHIAARHRGALTDGPFGSNLKTSHYTSAGPRVIRLQNIGLGQFINQGAHISESHYTRLLRHAVEPDDVLIALLGDPPARACLAPRSLGKAIVKADCVRLRVNQDLASPAYVMYGLNSESVKRQIAPLVHGVGRPRINLRDLRNVIVPLAPRDEQDRIVAEIDTQFSRLEAAIAGLERIRANLTVYRACVLKAAMEGRLVPTEAELARQEGREFEAGAVLLERALSRRVAGRAEGTMTQVRNGQPVASREVPIAHAEGWSLAPLSTYATRITKGTTPTSVGFEYQESGISFVRVENLANGRVDQSSISAFVSSEANEALARSQLQAGDLLFSIAGTIGRTALVREENLPANTNQALAIIRGTGDVLDPQFLRIVLASGLTQRSAGRRARGGAMKNISLGDVKGIVVPLPPAKEQERIAKEVGRIESVVEELERDVERNLRRVARLRQAILQWAFEGQLVDQDAQDQPATALLERIESSLRAAAAPAGTGRRK